MDRIACTIPRSRPWNKRKLAGQKTPLKLKEIWAIRIRLQPEERLLVQAGALLINHIAPGRRTLIPSA